MSEVDPQFEETPSTAGSTRRAFVKEIVIPIVLAAVSAQTTLWINQRAEQRHSLTISVLPSESATPQKNLDSVFTNPFVAPTPTPPPDPDPRYTYTVILRNDGDFPEENFVVLVGFREGKQTRDPLSGPSIGASSPLLNRTVNHTDPVQGGREYGLIVGRLNPNEWISLQATWVEPLKVSVEARSDTVSESAYE